MEVLASGTKTHGKKTGLNYETFTVSEIGAAQWPQAISKELKIASIRAGGPFRIFGCHLGGVFYVLWFDRLGEIVGH